MYLEITFKRTFYLQIGRDVARQHFCVYLISWGELYKNEMGNVVDASLHGILKSSKY